MRYLRSISLCLLLAFASVFALAQTPQPDTRDDQTPRQYPQQQRRERGERGAGKWQHRGPHAGDWLRRYAPMSPQEQEKALANDAEFQQLPPERQQHLRDRLQQFNNLPAERKQQILGRMEVFEHLAPEQKEKFRRYAEQFRQMPDDRRRTLRVELRRLREMSEEDRERELNSPRFKHDFSPQEIEMLRGMALAPSVGPHPDDRGEQRPPR